MNLITNAYHAVEEKGGTIDIELKETASKSFANKMICMTMSIPKLFAGKYVASPYPTPEPESIKR